MEIVQLYSIEEQIEGLSELLIQVVNDGAALGFLPPIELPEAAHYWRNVLTDDVILYVAQINNEIVGTIQLHLCTKKNGLHRAEVAKLMTHPRHRQKGIAKKLMQKMEERAWQEGRTLLILDTREGDPSNNLYSSLGYIQAGRIPSYAISEMKEYQATIIYYKILEDIAEVEKY